MVTLFCAFVGARGSAFPVDIDASELVRDLKDAIKANNPMKITCDAKDLQLYPAKMKDGKWLSSNTEDVKKLKEGEKTTSIEALIRENRELRGEDPIAEFLANVEAPKASQIHVLVVFPAEIKETLASLPHIKLKSYSNTTFGQAEIASLEKEKKMVHFAPVENGEAFWSEETQIQADAITDEAAFDAFITPFFSNVLHSCGMVFVNSEKYQWLSRSSLVTTNTDLKPDGFATHRGMFRNKPVPDDGVQRANGFRFGVADEELFDCLILFESKLFITEAAFGQVLRYLQNICPEASASAILFDRRSFWLIKSRKTVVFDVQIAKWANKGSKSLFQNFISDNMSPWVARLTNACIALGVDVVEGDAFLGRGAYGRVFKVTGNGGEVFALKIAEDVMRLYREQQALTEAQHTGVTISPVVKLIETDESAALLLSPVGKPLPRPTTREEVRDLFALLWQLHVNGVVHLDARVSNVILSDEKLLWIDPMEVMEAFPFYKGYDAELLTRSILSVSNTVSLDPALKQSIDSYRQSATRENIDHLAEVVWQSLALSS